MSPDQQATARMITDNAGVPDDYAGGLNELLKDPQTRDILMQVLRAKQVRPDGSGPMKIRSWDGREYEILQDGTVSPTPVNLGQ